MAEQSQAPVPLWLFYVLATVGSWGLYGVLLHLGQLGMEDPANGRIKAFLCVGFAYVLVAVLAPLGLLLMAKASWVFPTKGLLFSLLAGGVGAIGALCVLLAFGAKGNPAVVMSIVFAGAPIVNAVVALAVHPPAGGFSSLRWQFVAGILLAALGGLMVMRFRPGGPPPGAPAAGTTPR